MLKRIFASSFHQNIVVLMMGTVLSQAVPIALSPILTRLYSPEDFGVFALYFSLSMILSVIVTGRYEMAIILPKEHSDALSVTKLAMLISVSVSLVLFIILLIFNNEIAHMLGNEAIGKYLLFLPLTIMIVGIYQSLNYLSFRHEEFKALAFSRFARAFNTTGFSLGMGYFKFSKGLIVGDVIGQAIATVFIFFRCNRITGLTSEKISFEKLKAQAIRYKHFPIFNVPSGLLEKSSGQVPIIILTRFFGNAFVGQFSLSQRVISAPSTVIAAAVGDVFRQQAIKLFIQNGSCRDLFVRTLKNLFLLALVPFTILFIFSPPLFAFVFGEQWHVAGEYAQIMTPMFFLQFFVSPLSNMFYVAEMQQVDLVIQISLFVSLCSVLFIGFYFFKSSVVAISLFTTVYCIKYIIELILSYKFSLGNKDA
jgi:O-antigen/teichoic acid export membrane protein